MRGEDYQVSHQRVALQTRVLAACAVVTSVSAASAAVMCGVCFIVVFLFCQWSVVSHKGSCALREES